LEEAGVVTRDDFWQLIGKSGPSRGEDASEQTTALRQLLEDLPTDEIIAFERHLVEVMRECYRADLWDIVSVVQGGCSDDGFAYFRYWLILQGKDTFHRVLANPESIADFEHNPSGLSNQEFGSVALCAYRKKTGGRDMPYDGPRGPGQLKGRLLSNEERRRRYPALWDRFADGDPQVRQTESVSDYFRRLFADHPHFLSSRDSDEALQCFLRDHPGEQVTERIKAAMLNVKSSLRRERAEQ
jgi:hypothetical protein